MWVRMWPSPWGGRCRSLDKAECTDGQQLGGSRKLRLKEQDDQAQVHTPPSVSPTPSHATGPWSCVLVRFINKASDVRLLVLHGAHC